MNIGVFCSARDLADEYVEPVRDFAKHVGEHGHTLIWGGSATGVMRVVAEGVKAAGGRLVGITIEHYRADSYDRADEVILTRDLFDRKRELIERSDAIAILVGGIGTLDEATDIMELKREGAHNVPVVFLNTDGFYEPLREQLRAMEQAGMLDRKADALATFVDSSHDALDVLIAKATEAGTL